MSKNSTLVCVLSSQISGWELMAFSHFLCCVFGAAENSIFEYRNTGATLMYTGQRSTLSRIIEVFKSRVWHAEDFESARRLWSDNSEEMGGVPFEVRMDSITAKIMNMSLS